jgi:hypothetical protein
VLAGGFEERFVPLERREVLCGALVIQEIEEFALGFVALESLRLRVGASGREKEKKGSEKKTGLSRVSTEKFSKVRDAENFSKARGSKKEQNSNCRENEKTFHLY